MNYTLCKPGSAKGTARRFSARASNGVGRVGEGGAAFSVNKGLLILPAMWAKPTGETKLIKAADMKPRNPRR